MIKNIIFDFDGVLVDSETIVLKAFSKYMPHDLAHPVVLAHELLDVLFPR